MATQKYAIKNRWSGAVMFEAEIDASITDEGSKIGAAVKLAVKSSADLSGAYLSGADLSGAYLRGANLTRAYLSDADLSSAYLRDANLSRANLSRANLRGADLRGADLRGANLSGANLSGAKGISPELCTDLLMLLDQPGPKLRAYKLVDANFKSPIQTHGKLTYTIGSTLEEPNADTNVNTHCGAGLNVATLPWCLKEWREGCKILIVEFAVEDIAAIPTGTDGKFRTRRLKVIAEKQLDFVKLGLLKAEAA